MKAILEKTININSDKTENIGTVRQFDSTEINITLQGFTPTESTKVYLVMKRYDDTYLEQNDESVVITEGKISAHLKPEATAVDGVVFMNIVILDGDERITTCKMYYLVQSVLEGDIAEDNSESIISLQDLDKLIEKATADLETYESRVLGLANNIDELEQRVENLELNGGGSSGGSADIDLTEYAKKSYVDNAINKIQLTPGPKGEKGDKGDIGPSGLRGPQGIQGERGPQGLKGDKGEQGLQGIPGKDGITPDMSNYYTKSETDYAIVSATPNIDLTDYATKEYVSNEIKNASLGSDIDLSDYVTKDVLTTKISKIELTPGPKGEQGEKGDPFVYSDFTAEQLDALKGEKGEPGAKGEDGKSFTYDDFTPEQLESLKGEKGEKGETGPQGERGIQGEAGTPGAKGEKGDDGITPNITIGNVTTLESGENATVTNTGTIENPVFNFGIPKGEKGADGESSSVDLSNYATKDEIPVKANEIPQGSNLIIGTGVTKIEVVTEYPSIQLDGVLYIKVGE